MFKLYSCYKLRVWITGVLPNETFPDKVSAKMKDLKDINCNTLKEPNYFIYNHLKLNYNSEETTTQYTNCNTNVGKIFTQQDYS